MVAQLIVQPWHFRAENERNQNAAPAGPVRAAVSVPDDAEIAMARIAVASLSRGSSRLHLKFIAVEVGALLAGLERLGVSSHWDEAAGELSIQGAGLDGIRDPGQVLDVRGAAAAAALLIGISVARPFDVGLLVDPVVATLLLPCLDDTCWEIEEVHSESEPGVLVRLLARTVEQDRPVGPSLRLNGLFSWVKQGVLLAGLRAASPTLLEEELATADHMERALLRARAPLSAEGTHIELHPPRDSDALAPQTYRHVGSPELALAVFCAANAAEAGELSFRDVSLNPLRTAMVPLLRGLGVDARATPEGDREGEPIGRLTFSWTRKGAPGSAHVRSAAVAGETSIHLGDGVLYLFALAADSAKPWEIADFLPRARGADARVWARALGLLRSAGARVSETDQGCAISADGRPLRPLFPTSGGDGRLVLLATALALRGAGPSRIDDVDCLRGIFPRWVGTLRALGAKVTIEDERN